MTDQTLYLVLPYAVASLSTGIVAVMAWRRRGSGAARYFLLLALAASAWSAAAACSHLADDPAAKQLWSLLRFGPITLLPVAWLLFSLSFAAPARRMSAVWAMLLLVIPAATMVLIATNGRHLLVFTDTWIATRGALSTVSHSHGPWFWVHTVYSYLLIGSGIVAIGRHVAGAGERYYGQAAMMVAGALAPGAANLWYLSAPESMLYLDPTPVAFSVSTLFFAVGLFRYNLLDLAPIGRARILESMPDGVVVLDAEGRVLDCNPAAERMLRDAGRVIQGRRADDLGGVLATSWASRHSASPSDPALVTTDGEARWVAWTIHPFSIGWLIPRKLGRGWLLQFRDITVQKTAERQLREARDQALEHSRLKSAFLANVNHELRTPLTGILGLAEVLDEELTGEHRDFVRMIRASGERLMHTLDSLLAVSDLNSGRMLPAVQSVDVGRELARIVAEHRGEARRKGLDIWFAEPPETVHARVDPGHFGQAVHQVVDNAVKFTDHGAVAVTLSRMVEGVEVQIRDTGRGIQEDFLPHVFDAFRQESAGTARAYEGTGLGLQIARGLLERMGARIRIESEVGVGTTVLLLLPAADLPVRPGPAADREAEPRRARTSPDARSRDRSSA
jgi:signal transduction histidine kinase